MLVVAVAVVTPNGLHEKVAPAVVDVPVKVTVGLAQVMELLTAAPLFGKTVFRLTVITELVVQPLIGLVTVAV